MVVALAVAVACTAGLLGVVVWLAIESMWGWAFFAVGFLVIGLDATRRHRRPAEDAQPDRERVERHLARLCLDAGWQMPAVAIEAGDAPQTWTTATSRRRARVHVTVGFARTASDAELQAALAHELTHVAQGDAVVMTLVGGPPTWILAGIRHGMKTMGWRERLGLLIIGPPYVLASIPGLLAATMLSRQRELAADQGAAILTGSPAQVAATLVRFSDELARVRDRDLRAIGGNNLFYLLPAGRERRGIARLWASHPPLAVRLERLDAMERRLQGG